MVSIRAAAARETRVGMRRFRAAVTERTAFTMTKHVVYHTHDSLHAGLQSERHRSTLRSASRVQCHRIHNNAAFTRAN
jgi:hypothetical protein